ncbi:hypothetical protein C0992_009901 [Termitomyces sp. T32_za158]|nr:hypothetical protein C0992_009901 [Termitomyces sp. T32_za158]
MISASLLPILYLVLTVSANPIVVRESQAKLPLARRLNVTSVHNLLRHDVDRTKFLRARAEAKLCGASTQAVINEPVDNQALMYVASIGVGSPATTYELLVDTGSSNTWVGAIKPYIRTDTSVETENSVSVTYAAGLFSGVEFTDTVTIADGLVIPGQSIGVAATVEWTLPNLQATFPLRSPITGTPPASDCEFIVEKAQGLTDLPGTTFLLLASDAFARYVLATGAVPDCATGMLRLTSTQFANLQSLFFSINGVVFEFTANAQAWPRTLNTAIGGTPDNVYLIVGDLGTDSGEGFDFVNGFAFLERFYSVFDTGNKRVGFATTQFTTATIN